MRLEGQVHCLYICKFLAFVTNVFQTLRRKSKRKQPAITVDTSIGVMDKENNYEKWLSETAAQVLMGL